MSAPEIGRRAPRVDGVQKVTGRAKYAADADQPGQAWAVIVGSTVDRGRVIAIEDAPVRRMPGVLAVLTHRNAPRLPYASHKGPIDPAFGERLHVLQDDGIRYHGQPVAVVIARSLDEAEHAALALRVRQEAIPFVVEPGDPRAQEIVPGAATRPGSRVRADTARGDADAALAGAAVKVDVHFTSARNQHTPMEPHATIASWEGDRLTVWSKSQFVVNERAELAAILGLPLEQVQVICPFIGGAFGTSLRTWPHVTLAALASRHVGRPVKLVLSRRQTFAGTGYRPRTLQRVAIGASRDGRLTALVHEGRTETSRYEEYVEALTSVSSFLYSCPNVRTRYRLVPLDVATPTYMRGPGEATGMHALECTIDELAVALAIDPVVLRRRNEPAIDEEHGRPFSSRSVLRCMDVAAERFGWSRRTPEPRSMRDGRLLVGWGMALGSYPANQGACQARVRLLPDRTAIVEVAAGDMGPGTTTSVAQVAADALGLPLGAVRVRIGQTDFPAAPSHGGSQTMASVGSAVRAACLAAIEDARRQGPGQAVVATAGAARDPEVAARFSMHSFGAVFVEVTVDPDLGLVRVRRIVGAYGAGRIVNPRLAESQCTGGMIGGVGMALMERTVLDPRDGRPVNAHMADYLVPVCLDVPRMEVHFVPEDDPHVNPLGVKGLGEIAMVGVAPAIANAVYHATGRRIRELPIRVEHLL